jgi:hypothetical protein
MGEEMAQEIEAMEEIFRAEHDFRGATPIARV